MIALRETIRIMAEIDEVIDQHGGWPDGFATEPISEGREGKKQRSSGTAAAPKAEGEAAKKPDSEPWQMTRGQYQQYRRSQGHTDPTENNRAYWREIEAAIQAGKPVRPEVLTLYEQIKRIQ